MLAWHAGRAADCVAALRPAAARLLEMQARPWAAFALFDLAEAAAEAGDVAAVTAAAEDLHAVAEFVALPLYRGFAAAGSAWAALAVGDRGHAVVSARHAIELLASTDCAAYRARAHHVLGRAVPADARPEAVAALERAAAILGQCGGRWRRQRSLDALRRLGSAGRRGRRRGSRARFTDPPRARGGPARRDRHEREGDRRDAVRRRATVESHLASVYAKLGVDSKLQLVRRATELGLS